MTRDKAVENLCILHRSQDNMSGAELFRMGVIYQRCDLFKEALKWFALAKSNEPNNANIRISVIHSLINAGDNHRAIKELKDFSVLNGNTSGGMMAIVSLASRLKNRRLIVRALKKVRASRCMIDDTFVMKVICASAVIGKTAEAASLLETIDFTNIQSAGDLDLMRAAISNWGITMKFQ